MFNPLALICFVRFVWRNFGQRRPWISGHDMQEQQTEKGQPRCVHVMRCMACLKLDVTWAPCPKCGFGTTEARYQTSQFREKAT